MSTGIDMTPIGAASMQELYLEILRRANCNDLNGQRVYDDLLAHRDLWDAAYPAREAGGDDVTLRDLADESHDVDTLYLRTTKDKQAALLSLARKWGPDEADADAEKWGIDPKVIVRCWWD